MRNENFQILKSNNKAGASNQIFGGFLHVMYKINNIIIFWVTKLHLDKTNNTSSCKQITVCMDTEKFMKLYIAGNHWYYF